MHMHASKNYFLQKFKNLHMLHRQFTSYNYKILNHLLLIFRYYSYFTVKTAISLSTFVIL